MMRRGSARFLGMGALALLIVLVVAGLNQRDAFTYSLVPPRLPAAAPRVFRVMLPQISWSGPDLARAVRVFAANPSLIPPPVPPAGPRVYRVILPQVARSGRELVRVVPTFTPTPTPIPTATTTPTPRPLPTATPALQAEAIEPTATPVALPRLNLPPSPYQRLQDYPRPARDSGYGFHINGSPYPPEMEVLRGRVIPALNRLGARWVTVWVVDGYRTEAVKLLVDSGFEVVLRLHEAKPPHPDYLPSSEVVRQYVDVGVHYFVTGNEPNLYREWTGGDVGDVARQWVLASDRVKAGGGIPLLYPMSPGGDVAHREMLTGILEWLQAHNALDSLDGAGVAIHNRPHNKPLDHRDDTSFLEYEWIDDLIRSYVGRSLPLLATEAGYTFGDLIDDRFPRIDDSMHRDYNMGIIAGFQQGQWRDSLFTQNFWLLSGFGHEDFIADWWIGNPLYYGQDLPVVEALTNAPKFERRFRWKE